MRQNVEGCVVIHEVIASALYLDFHVRVGVDVHIGIGDCVVVAGEERGGEKNRRSTLRSTLSSDTSFVPLTYTYRSQQHSYVYTRVPIMHTDPPFEHLTS